VWHRLLTTHPIVSCLQAGLQSGTGLELDEGEASVLQPGENKLMLEFVGVERDLALLRRFNG